MEEQIKDQDVPVVDLEKLVEEGEFEELDFSLLSTFSNQEFALELLKTSSEYLGISRSSNIQHIGRFLRLFGLGTKDTSGKWMPFCAAGLSFAAAKTFCDLSGIKYNQNNAISVFKSVLLVIKDRFFRPSARVREIKETAINQGRYLKNTAANRKLVKPGYLILFQFDSDVMPDHIGIVVSADSDSVKTVEFNTSAENDTNGGAVSRRDRPFKTIDGFVKLY
jgi:hypothetical protein